MKLGLLEFGTGCVSPMDMVENVLDYAQQAEELGYTRFWLGEHYGTPTAYHNPEVLLPIIAGMTDRIKVGVAGLLMAFHNPYRVAASFKVLNNLFPNRIDLGVAGGGVPPEIGMLLAPDLDLSSSAPKVERFADNCRALYDYLFADENASLIAPVGGYLPTYWSLSAGLKNPAVLASRPTALCKSLFHTEITDHKRDAEKIQEYRAVFYEKHGREPEINLAVAGVCAETGAKARQIREALERPVSIHNELIGSPAYILDEVARLQEIYGVAEFIFLNMAEETDHKKDGIERLAQALPQYTDAASNVFAISY
ncbi:LLM class flavin-dependent oxidoreductase [Larkinella humicola]|uniref:LLM class flavin-dependent oxidoreductase n=1 Tax=Larkinella humicola TaxID=2607654 RepID=A0A5N1J7X9_9BACT|nr:LLM class flavin-dependent oxidoreductase [Larkinella humicola]KAA9347071.1 LLM class flavin-dependent oxidoreductase [Larkinella humicola]